MRSSSPSSKARPPKGEPFVWLSCMGLAIGLLMIVSLLGLIVAQGLEAFWPKRIVQLSLVPRSAAGIGGAETLGGEIVKRQEKPVRTVHSGERASPHLEWQLFVGNKDVHGFAFKFVDQDEIKDTAYPAGIIRIERVEYGAAIGYPVALTTGADRLAAEDPSFDSRLAEAVTEVRRRRTEIRRIEKSQIGAISRHMDDLRLRQRVLQRRNGAADAARAELDAISRQLVALEADYETLRARAASLRVLQERDTLIYRLMTGQEHAVTLGHVVSYSYPNRLGLGGRAMLFARNVWRFVSDDPREANTEGGIFPAIFGTFVMTLMMCVVVTPFGVLAAIYLREYAREGPLVRAVRIAINNLAGVPSIVFGVFGLGFFVYAMGGSIDRLFFADRLPTPTFGTGGLLWASLTLALMTVPVVIVASEEALAAVSRGMREGSLACGASKWQTIQRVVLPASAPGIITGMILAMARGAGEVAPLMLVGVVKLAPSLPIDATSPYLHLDRKFMHLGFHIYDLGFQSPDSEAARPMVFATTLLLITLVVVMNLGAIVVRERLRRKYNVGAF